MATLNKGDNDYNNNNNNNNVVYVRNVEVVNALTKLTWTL